MGDKVRFGLIGCGDFGRTFAEYVLEVGDIIAVCDSNIDAAEATATKHSLDGPRYDDYRRMLDEQKPDAVVITTANFAHAEIAVAAADAGCHIYCEKAMARTVPECWEMAQAAHRHKVKMMIGHKRRLRPPWARMIELTDEALLGELLSITVAQYCDYRPLKMYDTWWMDATLGGGFFHLHGIHVLDWFRALCGDAKRVRSVNGPQHDSRFKYPDVVHATIEFNSGAVACLNGGTLHPLQQFRQCQGSLAECRHGGWRMVPHFDHMDLFWQRLDQEEVQHERFDDLGHATAFRRELGDFVDWVTEGRTPCLTWIEGLRTVELAEAACRSAANDGEPIALPLYPQLEDAEVLAALAKQTQGV